MSPSVQNKDVPPNQYIVNKWRKSALTQLHQQPAALDLPPGPVYREEDQSGFTLASFPGLPTIQFLISCKVCKNGGGRPGSFYHVNDVSST